MATITITPGWAGPASAVGTNPIVVQVAGVGPPGAAGTSGVAPSGTGIVTVTSGTLNTPAALTGDVTTTAGGLATTLATVNSNVGTFTNASVTVNAKGLVTAASSGAAGGITIGDTVTSGTSGRVLYVGAGPVLAQDAGLTYDPATDTLTAGPVTAVGTVTVRQSGGVAGTDEVQISHDGTYGTVRSYDGRLCLRPSNGIGFNVDNDGSSRTRFTGDSGSVLLFDNATIVQVGGAGSGNGPAFYTANMRMGSGGVVLWSDAASPTSGSDRAGVTSSAAKVVGLTDGSTGGATLSSVPLTPAQITANQNNYAPGVARYYRLSTDASRDITGLSCSQVSGQECEIWNVDANSIVLKHQDANSTAANRFICTGAADITLAQDEVCLLRYDSVSSRWRVRKI